eukprot:2291427-Rhodomonas_salina.2
MLMSLCWEFCFPVERRSVPDTPSQTRSTIRSPYRSTRAQHSTTTKSLVPAFESPRSRPIFICG